MKVFFEKQYETLDILKKENEYCILIPVINEGERIQKQLKSMSEFSNSIDIIIADGGSTDNSLDPSFLKGNRVNTLLIKKGPGKLSRQLQIGFYHCLKAGYKGIITVDGNNKDDVLNYVRILDKLKEGYDFVQGSRYVKGGMEKNTPLIRKLAIKFIHAPFSSLFARQKYTDTTNGFRGHSAKLLSDSKMNIFREVFAEYELLTYISIRSPKYGFKVCEVPVTRSYPKNEKTPTKIKGLKGNLKLLKTLFKTGFGYYDAK